MKARDVRMLVWLVAFVGCLVGSTWVPHLMWIAWVFAVGMVLS